MSTIERAGRRKAMPVIKIAPSILSADYACLGDAVEKLDKSGADYIHFDVMDGCFVPNITFGPGTLRALRKRTNLPFDAHLMVEKPSSWIDQFVDAGADIITLHVEAELHPQRQLERIKNAGKKAGLVLNPATPIKNIECVLEYCDMVLLMSVNPGFGGQSFLPYTLNKIRELKEITLKRGLETDIEVDGGINEVTAMACIEAGANVLVAGNAVFSSDDMANTIKKLRGEM